MNIENQSLQNLQENKEVKFTKKLTRILYIIVAITVLSFFVFPNKSTHFSQGGVLFGYECRCLGLKTFPNGDFRNISCFGVVYDCVSHGDHIDNLTRNSILLMLLRLLPLILFGGFVFYKKDGKSKKFIIFISIIAILSIGSFFLPIIYVNLSNKNDALKKQESMQSPSIDQQDQLIPDEKKNILCYPKEYENQIYRPIKNKSKFYNYYFEYNNKVYFHQSQSSDTNGNVYGPSDIKFQNSSPATFKCIDRNFAKDKNNVYYWGSQVEKADPETFKPLAWPKAEDKNYYFSQTKIERIK